MRFQVNDCRPSSYQYQLQSGDPWGGVNCAAYCLSEGLDFDSCGAIQTTGAMVRALSSEPIPDPRSPGLHHGQLRDVASKWGVPLTLLSGVPFAEVEDALTAGHGILLAVNYKEIRPTSFSGQRSFYGNHELLVMPGLFTFDPLADGRVSNGTRVYKGPGVYPVSLLRRAAGDFVTRYGSTGRVLERLGYGRAVAAVLPHRHPLGLPDTGTEPPVTPGPSKERNVAILTAYSGHRFKVAKGTPLYRYPGGPKVTQMSAAGEIEYVGKAGAGWVAVKVGTGALYADGIVRPTVLYAPSTSGVLV